MAFQRLAAAAALAAAVLTNADVFASQLTPEASLGCVEDVMQALISPPPENFSALYSTPIVASADVASGSGKPDFDKPDFDKPDFAKLDADQPDFAKLDAGQPVAAVASPRQMLADFAMKLRDIRYRRGGRVPSTGFDCSGFVHYVFAHALGIDLPDNSISQFNAGIRVARDDMKTGDLVFFHIHGKRISHVGIYLGEGRFIHSPRTGERVRVNRLDEQYWAHRFAGAKRPESLSS